MSESHKVIIVAGGCFWGVEELFRHQPGVIATCVGYCGGDVPYATYHNHGDHAEAVKITYDCNKTDVLTLLRFFFKIHDPTTISRQGNDVGRSYRSVIFYSDQQEKKIAQQLIERIDKSGFLPSKIVTELVPITSFWEAEPEHQNYLQHYPSGYSCHYIRHDWVIE